MTSDNDITRLLVDVLAVTDATWRTPRFTIHRRAFKHAWSIRQQYLQHGIPWSVGGAGADRTAGHRLLRAAAAEGLIRVSKSRGANSTTHVRLTDAGEWTSRAIVGVNWLPEAWQTLQPLAEVSDSRWASEFDLGVPDDADRYGPASWAVEVEIAPALVAGWCEQLSDTVGRAFYRLTDSGRAAIDVDPPTCPLDDIPPPIEGFDQLYADRTSLAIRDFDRMADPDPQEVGLVPLSACYGASQ